MDDPGGSTAAGGSRIKLKVKVPQPQRRSAAGRAAAAAKAAATASDDEEVITLEEVSAEEGYDDDPEEEISDADEDDDVIELDSDDDAAAAVATKPKSKAKARAAPRRGAAKPAAKPRGAAPKKRAAPARRSRDREDIDLEEEFDSEDIEEGAYVLGAEDAEFQDFSSLELKPDHRNRPLWVCPDGRVFLETFSPVYKQAYDFLIAVAEPVSRPECIHEYMLTPHSLYAAVSIGLETTTIVAVLERLSKARLPDEVREFVHEATDNYGKVKLVLLRNKFHVESPYPAILKELLEDDVIKKARVVPAPAAAAAAAGGGGGDGGGAAAAAAADGFVISRALKDRAVANLASVQEIDLTAAEQQQEEEDEDAAEATQREDNGGERPVAMQIDGGGGGGPSAQQSAFLLDAAAEEDPDRELHSFEIEAAQVEHVKARCLPGGLGYPMLEEYDFRGDTANPTLNFELKPHVKHRPYQEKSLSKMFGNSRARSGIIVLPCGAGKSLVGVSAAARVKKSCLVLCTNAVSVDQWKYQFQLWTTLRDDQVCRFTSDKHEWMKGSGAGVCITTYTMVAYNGRRSEESERIMGEIMGREWGLLVMDEVHVVPAQMFRRVIGIVKAHCKLGLTATLVREDALITDLNFLIGPKLYEANWLDLTRAGHIASVQCAEVWCPMTPEFMREYCRRERTAGQRALLFVMNPAKLRACQYLVQYHEQRGDKVIVFSDNIFALREYAMRLRRPFIYGATGHQERTRVLHAFKSNPAVNTVFLSKVGDNSLDIPEANVLIQISSHAGSRRQEAQRLGRILRKKKARPGAAAAGAPGAPAAEEYDAFFYTLMSTDTQEVFYASKRQQFLVDQGYSYKVIPSLLESAGGAEGLALSTQEEQLDLLAAVMAASEAEAATEEMPADRDALRERGARAAGVGAARRNVGSFAALSGGAGMRYLEYSTKAGKGKSAGKLAKFRRM